MTSNEQLAHHQREDHELRYVDEVPTSVEHILGEDDAREPRRSTRFNTTNEQAVPVYERATNSFSAYSQAIGAAAIMLLGRHKGRKYVTLSVPTTITSITGATSTPNGIQRSHDRNLIDQAAGFQLNPGDSVEIDSESEVWVGPLPTKTTGLMQVLEVYHANGGPADS